MTNLQLEILKQAYQSYLDGKNQYGYNRSDYQIKEYQKILTELDYLVEKDFITYVARASGFITFKITAYGIDFVENDFREPDTITNITQGNNSIYVQGSGNTISDNYNQITVDINNSDLPPDCKELINNFLYEIKNPNLSHDKKNNKIKEFLSSIASGTLSNTASTALTTLLASIFKYLSF